MSEKLLSKAELRKQMLQKRRSLSLVWREQASKQTIQSALKIPQILKAKNIGLYWPHDQELDLRPLWQHLSQQGKFIYFPRVSLQKNTMEFVFLTSESELISGSYGILEPKATLPSVAKENIEVVFIPALAFDTQGYRLGWGKGYFDKWLEGYKGFRLGVGYDFQLLEEIPREIHDERVEALLTEKHFLSFKLNSISG